MFRAISILLILVASTSRCLSAVIDDFSDGPTEILAGSSIVDPVTGQPVSSASVVQTGVQGVLGGTRVLAISDVQLDPVEGNDEGFVSMLVDPASGVLRVNGNQKPEVIAAVYGSIDSPLNLNLSEALGIAVSFLSYTDIEPDRAPFLRIRLTSSVEDVREADSHLLEFPAGFDGGILFTPMEAFDDVELTDVDLISVDHSPRLPFSYEIDQITIVPEPLFSGGLAMLFMAGMFVRRRRRS